MSDNDYIEGEDRQDQVVLCAATNAALRASREESEREQYSPVLYSADVDRARRIARIQARKAYRKIVKSWCALDSTPHLRAAAAEIREKYIKQLNCNAANASFVEDVTRYVSSTAFWIKHRDDHPWDFLCALDAEIEKTRSKPTF